VTSLPLMDLSQHPAKNFTKSIDPERLIVRDRIYHYWGTAWAVIGLLETLGKSGS
jgi:hypothetical protein